MKRFSTVFSLSVIVLSLGLMLFSLTPTIAHYGNLAADKVWQPKLVCEQTTYDFGKIQTTDKPNYSFVLENQGNRGLLIKGVVPGCGSCVNVVEYTEVPIAPQKSGTVNLELITQNLVGPVSKEVLVMTNDPTQAILTLTLEAEIAP